MATISPRDFVGTRARLSRTSDGAELNGWINDVAGPRITVLVPICSLAEVGDKFKCELHGKKSLVVLEAALEKISAFDDATGKPSSFSQSSNAVILQSEWAVMHFLIDGLPQSSVAALPFRTLVEGVGGDIQCGPRIVSATIRDVASKGVGVMTSEPMPEGNSVSFVIYTPLGPVQGQGVLQYCRPWAKGQYRSGIRINQMGRLDRHRWDRFVTEA